MSFTDNYIPDISIFTSHIVLNLPSGWKLLNYQNINLANMTRAAEVSAIFAMAQQKQQLIYIPQMQKNLVWSPTIIAQSGFFSEPKDNNELLLNYTQLLLPNAIVNLEENFLHNDIKVTFIRSSYDIEEMNFSTRSMLLTLDAINQQGKYITKVISLTGTWLSNTTEVGTMISQAFDTLTLRGFGSFAGPFFSDSHCKRTEKIIGIEKNHQIMDN